MLLPLPPKRSSTLLLSPVKFSSTLWLISTGLLPLPPKRSSTLLLSPVKFSSTLWLISTGFWVLWLTPMSVSNAGVHSMDRFHTLVFSWIVFTLPTIRDTNISLFSDFCDCTSSADFSCDPSSWVVPVGFVDDEVSSAYLAKLFPSLSYMSAIRVNPLVFSGVHKLEVFNSIILLVFIVVVDLHSFRDWSIVSFTFNVVCESISFLIVVVDSVISLCCSVSVSWRMFAWRSFFSHSGFSVSRILDLESILSQIMIYLASIHSIWLLLSTRNGWFQVDFVICPSTSISTISS